MNPKLSLRVQTVYFRTCKRILQQVRIDLHTPKLVIIQFHTSNVWKNVSHTIFIQFLKTVGKKFAPSSFSHTISMYGKMVIIEFSYNFLYVWHCMEMYDKKFLINGNCMIRSFGQPGRMLPLILFCSFVFFDCSDKILTC